VARTAERDQSGNRPRPRRGLAKLRKNNGWSQEALAAKLEVSVGTVSRWESGESRPHDGNIRRLAEAFGRPIADVQDLFDESGGGAQVVHLPGATEQTPMADALKLAHYVDLLMAGLEDGRATNANWVSTAREAGALLGRPWTTPDAPLQ
jgi:transcriptional regulator with XRE-family HTH domain